MLTKAPRFSDAKLELLAEALARLREAKVDARAALVALPGHERMTPRVFGIPAIDELARKVEALQDAAWGAS